MQDSQRTARFVTVPLLEYEDLVKHLAIKQASQTFKSLLTPYHRFGPK